MTQQETAKRTIEMIKLSLRSIERHTSGLAAFHKLAQTNIILECNYINNYINELEEMIK